MSAPVKFGPLEAAWAEEMGKALLAANAGNIDPLVDLISRISQLHVRTFAYFHASIPDEAEALLACLNGANAYRDDLAAGAQKIVVSIFRQKQAVMDGKAPLPDVETLKAKFEAFIKSGGNPPPTKGDC